MEVKIVDFQFLPGFISITTHSAALYAYNTARVLVTHFNAVREGPKDFRKKAIKSTVALSTIVLIDT